MKTVFTTTMVLEDFDKQIQKSFERAVICASLLLSTIALSITIPQTSAIPLLFVVLTVYCLIQTEGIKTMRFVFLLSEKKQVSRTIKK
jgi:hypothetical protein